jgi:hypothetical protein
VRADATVGVLVGWFVLSGELLGEADEELRELGVSSSSSSLLPKGRAEQADKLSMAAQVANARAGRVKRDMILLG